MDWSRLGWPVGGWRLAAGPMLMPSDLWGQEGVLEVIVARAGLRSAGREWVAATRTRTVEIEDFVDLVPRSAITGVELPRRPLTKPLNCS